MKHRCTSENTRRAPADTVVILTTSRPDRLLATIVSRCQHLRFEPLSATEIQSALEQREELSADQSSAIARLANGSYTRAVELVHTDVGQLRTDALDFLRVVLAGKRKELLDEVESLVAGVQKSELEVFFQMLQAWIRDAMLVNEGRISSVNAGDAGTLQKFVTRYPALDVASAQKAVERAVSLLRKNVYIPLILLNLAFTLHDCIAQPRSLMFQ